MGRPASLAGPAFINQGAPIKIGMAKPQRDVMTCEPLDPIAAERIGPVGPVAVVPNLLVVPASRPWRSWSRRRHPPGVKGRPHRASP